MGKPLEAPDIPVKNGAFWLGADVGEIAALGRVQLRDALEADRPQPRIEAWQFRNACRLAAKNGLPSRIRIDAP
jgi:hypothetical protein